MGQPEHGSPGPKAFLLSQNLITRFALAVPIPESTAPVTEGLNFYCSDIAQVSDHKINVSPADPDVLLGIEPSLFELSDRERQVFGFDCLAVCACLRTLEPGKP